MREEALLHTRDEHDIELQALCGMYGHESDGRLVLAETIEIGPKAHPLKEVRKRITAKDADRLCVLSPLCARRGIHCLVLVMGLNELVDNAEELLDVLDSATRLVGVLQLERGDKAGFLHDRLDELAQRALVGLALF